MRRRTLRALSTQEMELGYPRWGTGRQGIGKRLRRPLCPCSSPRPRVSHRKQVPPEPGGEREHARGRRKLYRKLALSQLPQPLRHQHHKIKTTSGSQPCHAGARKGMLCRGLKCQWAGVGVLPVTPCGTTISCSPIRGQFSYPSSSGLVPQMRPSNCRVSAPLFL